LDNKIVKFDELAMFAGNPAPPQLSPAMLQLLRPCDGQATVADP
jgi:hypothetical protein